MSLRGTFSPEQEAVIRDAAGMIYAAGADTACSNIIDLYWSSL